MGKAQSGQQQASAERGRRWDRVQQVKPGGSWKGVSSRREEGGWARKGTTGKAQAVTYGVWPSSSGLGGEACSKYALPMRTQQLAAAELDAMPQLSCAACLRLPPARYQNTVNVKFLECDQYNTVSMLMYVYLM